MASVTVKAPGKINLALHVGPLTQAGYHDLVTVFQAVDIYETITATESSDFSVRVIGDVILDEIPLDDNNLAMRAAKAIQAHTGFAGGVALHIDKKVPVGGGMAGGSADAAGTLVAVDALWGTHLSSETLLDIASSLGSDVPFGLHGYTQIGRGRGEILEKVPSLPFYWVVVPQTRHLSTPLVYSVLDEMRGSDTPDLPEAPSAGLLDALFRGDAHALASELVNDLAVPALTLAPEIQSVLDLGTQLGALATMVSGSGPTCIYLAEDKAHQDRLLDGCEQNGTYALRATSPARGAHVSSREGLS